MSRRPVSTQDLEQIRAYIIHRATEDKRAAAHGVVAEHGVVAQH